MASIHADLHERSLRDPDGFWGIAAEAIHWDRRWDKVLDQSGAPLCRWFSGGMLNTCYNALDVHIERGRAKQRALIYDSPVTNTVRIFTYAELRDLVARFAGALVLQGVGKGDRVVIYMPMVPEAVIGMLACASGRYTRERRHRGAVDSARARRHRRGGLFSQRRRFEASAEDPLGQDPPRHDEEDRGRRGHSAARHD